MHRDLEAYHRVLAAAYRRYLEADRALVSKMREMRAVFPPGSVPRRGTLGAPGSPIRRLREERDQALAIKPC